MLRFRCALWLLCSLIATLGSVVLPAQQVLHVPADQPSVQAAINAAQTGDTVLISPGTYTESIDFLGKAITVSGTTSAAEVTLAGDGQHPTVSFTTGEGRSSVLTSLTVAGGGSASGTEQAGIYVLHAGPTLSSLEIVRAVCHGLHAVNGNPLLEHSHVAYTVSVPVNATCPIADGSGVFIDGPTNNGTAVVQTSIIENNTAIDKEEGGAGVFARMGATMLIQGNVIRLNSATGRNAQGGAVLMQSASGLLFNNLIYRNSSYVYGGGVTVVGDFFVPSAVRLLNNTLVDNYQTYSTGPFTDALAGSDVLVQGRVKALLSNNIISRDDRHSAVTCDGQGVGQVVNFSFDDIRNPTGPTTADAGLGLCDFRVGLSGNSNADPQFANPALDDFHLQPQSPDIDSGYNVALAPTNLLGEPNQFYGANLTVDLDGNPRIVNGHGTSAPASIDLGAFEFGSSNMPSPLQLSGNPNPSVLGQPVTLTATLSPGGGYSSGVVTISDGSAVLGFAALNNGTAQFATTELSVGTHVLTALFTPNTNAATLTASFSQIVTGQPTSTTLSITPSTGPALSAFTLSARVTAATGNPTGTVRFTAGRQTLATASVQADGSAQAVVPSLAGGSYSVIAIYSGDGGFGGSASGPVALTVTPNPVTLTLTAFPSTAPIGTDIVLRAAVQPQAAQSGNPTAAPTGTVTLRFGAQLLGSMTLDATGTVNFTAHSLPAGQDTLVAEYSGDPNNLPASASATVRVTLLAATLSLASNLNPSYLGQSVTLTATAISDGVPLDGTVSFFDGVTLLASAQTSSGRASCTTTTLTPGQHALTASLQPASASYAAAATLALTQTVLNAGFTLSLSPANLLVQTGKNTTTLLKLTSFGNFAGPLRLATAALPSHASASFESATLQLTGGSTAITTLHLGTLDLEASPAGLAGIQPGLRSGTRSTLPVLLACGFPFFLRKRRRAITRLLPCLAAGTLLALSGCTNRGFPIPTVTPGVYTLQVTATDDHNNTQAAVLHLAVTP